MRDGRGNSIGIDDPARLALQLFIEGIDHGAQKHESRAACLLRPWLEVQSAEMKHGF
jgi:hypothetical protein